MATNEDRARWALEAVKALSKETGAGTSNFQPMDVTDDDAVCEAFRDLLADLGHLADQRGWDFPGLVAGALSVYLSEAQDEDEIRGPNITILSNGLPIAKATDAMPDPQAVHIEDVTWKEVGEVYCDDDPGCALKAEDVVICGVNMHLEALAVTPLAPDEDFGSGVQPHEAVASRYEELVAFAGGDGPFETMSHKGREYVLFATPFCN